MTAEELLAEYQAGRLTWEEYQIALQIAIAAAKGLAGAGVDNDDYDDQAPVVTLLGIFWDTSVIHRYPILDKEKIPKSFDAKISKKVMVTNKISKI